MGTEEKSSLFRNPEVVSMARESATVVRTAPVPPCEEDAKFCEDLMPRSYTLEKVWKN
jgi:hypothetical protein